MTTLRVWATHPATKLAGNIALVAVLVLLLASTAGTMVERSTINDHVTWWWGADAVVAVWTIGCLLLLTVGQLVVVPRVTGHAGRHRERPARQVSTVPPAIAYLPGRASIREVAR